MKITSLSKIIVLLVAGSLLLSACGPKLVMAQSELERNPSPGMSVGEVQTLANDNNSFALDLYQGLRSQDGNLIFSPYSISLALAMAYAGASGETEAQMAETLHYDLPQELLHPTFNALDLALVGSSHAESTNGQPMQLSIVNAAWAEQTYPFRQEYLDQIALNYGAGIHLADFINKYEAARKEINAWVSDQTRDKIRDLIPQGVIDSWTRLVLVNAIYFKADWAQGFDANHTRKAPFHLLDGSEAQVDMMSESLTSIPYANGEGYQAVELAYQGGTAVMDILVPDEGRFNEFEVGLDAGRLDAILDSLKGEDVDLSMPRFEFDSQFDLSGQLAGMGMPDAFDDQRADFSGMTGGPDLFITDVIHKAFVAVDEKGTEAAAATAVIMAPTSAMPPGTQLTIDRPFIFLIREPSTGQILFIGRVLDPGS